MSDINWKTPPKDPRGSGGRKSKWSEVFKALRARPGEWALVHTGSAAVAYTIKKGRVGDASPGEFEAVARGIGDHTWDIYARFVGEVTQ